MIDIRRLRGCASISRNEASGAGQGGYETAYTKNGEPCQQHPTDGWGEGWGDEHSCADGVEGSGGGVALEKWPYTEPEFSGKGEIPIMFPNFNFT